MKALKIYPPPLAGKDQEMVWRCRGTDVVLALAIIRRAKKEAQAWQNLRVGCK